MSHAVLASIDFGAWKLTPAETTIDLIAASTNALNGALLCRRPDHYKNFTVVGVILMAVLGGVGGGVTRDVLVNKVPAALTNPAYISRSAWSSAWLATTWPSAKVSCSVRVSSSS